MRSGLGVVVVSVTALSACYRPLHPERCEVRCPDHVCPSGYSCSAGFCLAPGEPACGAEVDAGSTDDASIDSGTSGIDGSASGACSQLVPTACYTGQPGDVSLSSDLSTDTCGRLDAQPGGPPVCVMVAHSFQIPAGTTIHVSGMYPLLLVAGTIDIAGDLSVRSDGIDLVGAGANFDCPARSPPLQTGGGAGGSYGTSGGDGGRGGANDGNVAAAAIPGHVLAGGCPGDPASALAPGGNGGGAVWLFAADTITVTGRVEAGGAGGTAGQNGTVMSIGGAGGGAGGMIGIEAQAVVITGGSLHANGGGGGGGSVGSSTGMDGMPGASTQAMGGLAGNDGMGGAGGSGGSGGFAGSVGAQGLASAFYAAGGGGGGEGRIFLVGTVQPTGSTISPPAATTLP